MIGHVVRVWIFTALNIVIAVVWPSVWTIVFAAVTLAAAAFVSTLAWTDRRRWGR